jgi:hypothetical protein
LDEIIKTIKWVVDNKEWLFSGVGIVVVLWIGRAIFKVRQAKSSQKIRSGNNSINMQAGRDIKIKGGLKQENAKKE